LQGRCPRGRWDRSRVRCPFCRRLCRCLPFRCPGRCHDLFRYLRQFHPNRGYCLPRATWRGIRFLDLAAHRPSCPAGSTSPCRNLCRFRHWLPGRDLSLYRRELRGRGLFGPIQSRWSRGLPQQKAAEAQRSQPAIGHRWLLRHRRFFQLHRRFPRARGVEELRWDSLDTERQLPVMDFLCCRSNRRRAVGPRHSGSTPGPRRCDYHQDCRLHQWN